MKQTVVLGIDTSAYTCSVAVMSAWGELKSDIRMGLQTPTGTRGLRQSEAVYQHVRLLPQAVQKALTAARFPQATLAAIAFSGAPRPPEDSFMPVFMTGATVAQTMALAGAVPSWQASHQEGHIWAALWGCDAKQFPSTLLAVHLSGGTTEAVLVENVGAEHRMRPDLRVVAASGDLNAGQFVDRIGVALGLPFPAGPHLERLADRATRGKLRLPLAVRGTQISFSGPESAAQRLIRRGCAPEDIAWAALDCLAGSVESWLAAVAASTGQRDFVMAGGVMANQHLRHTLLHSPVLSSCRFYWAPINLSSDNAVGLAAWAAARVSGLPLSQLPMRLHR